MSRSKLVLLGLVLLVVTVVYANHFRNGFHFDDYHAIVDNPYVRSLHYLPRFFVDGTTFSVLPPNQTYRPFVTAVMAIDYALGHGYNPVWFQLSTFLVFLLQMVAMYVLFNAILDSVRPEAHTEAANNQYVSLIAVVWYGLHPAMAETVNYIIQCGDIFSTFGVVAALAVYAQFPTKRKAGLYLLPFIFGMLSKPPAMVFPVLLFIYIVMFEEKGQDRYRKALVASIPAVAVCVALTILQIVMTPKTFVVSGGSGTAYRVTQPFVLLRYFGSFFLPVHLNVDTDLGAFSHLTANAIWGLLFVAILLLVIWITSRRRILRPISFGLIWFLVASLPTSLFALAEVENDHRMYMPFVGLVLAVVWTFVLLVEQSSLLHRSRDFRIAAAAIAFAAMSGYAWGAHIRNQIWNSEDSLWLDDIQKCPENGRGLMVYGISLMNHGNLDGALAYLAQAQQYAPNYTNLEVNLGVVLSAMHRPVEADPHFRRAIALNPNDDQTHFYYGRELVQLGKLNDGMTQLQIAYRQNPARLETRYMIMSTYAIMGKDAEARQIAIETLRIAPRDSTVEKFLAQAPTPITADYWLDVALQQCQSNSFQECLASAKHALQIKPDFPEALDAVAVAYGQMHDYDNSIAASKEALRIKPGYQMAVDNLAMAEKAKKGAQ